MRTADLITAAVLVAGAAVVIFDSLRLGIGWGTDGPNSGFFPFWLGTIMIVACLLIMGQALRRSTDQPFVRPAQLRSVLKVLWPATAAVLLMQVVGLYVASALYMGFYMRWVGRHRWATVVAIAVGVPVATFLIFEQWFLVPMPKGPLETWLGY
jgi:putative tricarboxylic transport membrane protein